MNCQTKLRINYLTAVTSVAILENSVVYCPDPGQISFGVRRNAQGSFTGSTQRYSPGQAVIYSCRQGYELQGNRLITCLRTGEWSSKKPRCVRYRTAISGTRGGEVSCSHPGVNENTEITGDYQDSQLDQAFPPGTELRYVCKEGYESEGAMTIYCLRTGQWTSVAPSCRSVTPSTTTPGPACRHPGADINGLIEDHPLLDPRKRGQTFPPGTELKFYCREGFEPVGATILYCLRSGEWSTAPPSCRAIPTTTAVSPAETRIQCTHPGVDPNAEVEVPPIDPRKLGPGFDAGEVLTYTCKDGYDMEGQASISCLRNGQWSDSAPRCNLRSRVADGSSNLAQCENLGPISNGRVVVFRTLDERRQPSTSDQEDFEYPAGTRLHYSCEEGFAIRGESNLVCETTGFWSAEAPLCIEGIL
ncbi:CUB and sushi domain-containing protein 1 [Trichonephila clavipes]|nr:CUB and sushi domain-containing protein 1 [Trichonephila clavipes]